jgi:hypothetical protein
VHEAQHLQDTDQQDSTKGLNGCLDGNLQPGVCRWLRRQPLGAMSEHELPSRRQMHIHKLAAAR